MRLKTTLRRAGAWIAVAIAFAAILRVTKLGAWIHPSTALHAAVHFLVFACLTVLLTLTIRSPWKRLLFFVGIALLGLGTEVYESLRNGGDIEVIDVIEDTVGAAVGLLLGETAAMMGMWMWQRRRIRAWVTGEGVGRRDGLTYALYKTHLQRYIPRRSNAPLDVSPRAHFFVYLSRVAAAGRAHYERWRRERAERRFQPGGTLEPATVQGHDQGADPIWRPPTGNRSQSRGD